MSSVPEPFRLVAVGCGRGLLNEGGCRSNKHRPDLSKFGPRPTEFSSNLITFDQTWPGSGQRWPDIRLHSNDLSSPRSGTLIVQALAPSAPAAKVISDMMKDSLEASVQKAKDVVREQIDDLVATVAETASTEEILKQVRSLPAQVQQIAGDYLWKAVVQSEKQARAAAGRWMCRPWGSSMAGPK